MRNACLLALWLLAAFPIPFVRGAEQRLPCIADTGLSSFPSESDLNYGRKSHLRLKGIEMLALFQFDLAPVAGWEVESATLHLRYADADRKLRTLGFSTVSAPWEEGTGSGEHKRGAACFNWRAYPDMPWAAGGNDFTDVSFTTGNTLAAYADIRETGDSWFAVPVSPELVQAMLAGVSYGLAVTDEKGQTRANNDVYAREQAASAPYLVVSGKPGPKTMPTAVTGLTLEPGPPGIDPAVGAVRISFNASPDAYAFDAHYRCFGEQQDREAPRYAIPFATPGKPQSFVLDRLPAGAKITDLQVIPISRTGVRGSAAHISGTIPGDAGGSQTRHHGGSDILYEEAPPKVPPARPALAVWAVPETEKVHPVSGNALGEAGGGAYAGKPVGKSRKKNSIWIEGTVCLKAARNEVVAFHFVIEPAGESARGIRITLGSEFDREDVTFDQTLGDEHMRPAIWLYRDWYVKDGEWFPEVCVPLTGPFDIPAADNAVPGQRNQAVLVELLVPRDAKPGYYESEFTISAEGVRPFQVPVELEVFGVTLPDTLSFDVSLNAYGTVGHLFGVDHRTPEYDRLEREYHRMAHLHRATLALLGYSHSGNISPNYAPPLAGRGKEAHVADWSRWDAKFGPLLDGSAFADLPRGNIPVSHLYLPFHEAWPADIRAHYRYRPTVTAYPGVIVEHAMQAPPIEEAFAAEFADSMTAVVRDFARHFYEKGWDRTQFQFYLNNKSTYRDPKQGGRGTSWWLLDEPCHRDDWLALAYFSRLMRPGRAAFPSAHLVFREDISRPQWQRDYLDGLVDLMVVSGGEMATRERCLAETRRRLNVRYWGVRHRERRTR